MQSKKIIYSSEYEIDIGLHVFPTSKYRLIKEYLIKKYSFKENDFIEPEPADISSVMHVHTEKYVNDIYAGTLSYADEVRLELPYSRELAKASFMCCGGTELTCEQALESNLGIHLGGGFHHAYADHGEGFCVFNDIALGVVNMVKKGKRVLVVDCDLHQGNGTASILKNKPGIYTFSMHQKNNYPFHKEKSDYDIPLKDGISGKEYNALLDSSLKKIKSDFNPDYVIYVAGSDTYCNDQLGGLSLSIDDLINRDRIIKFKFHEMGIPVAIVLAGGYAKRIEDTVFIHANTVAVFLELI